MTTTQTKQIELYIEKIRGGIEVSGTIENDYVELRYKYFLNSLSDLEGYKEVSERPSLTVVRTYGEICGRNMETNDYGDWKTTSRKKIDDEMYNLIGIAENFLNENHYMIVE